MEKKIVEITVDCEKDWGWRTETTQGIEEGLPKIIKVFKKYGVDTIYFVAPEYQGECKGELVGLHPKREDVWCDIYKYVRGHKFWKFPGWEKYLPYSSPKNHTSLLRHMWYGQPMRKIFYLHPFDIVKPKTKPPNLFCKLWYSQPERAYSTFKRLVERYG